MSEHEKRRNRRINKLMGDLWDVVENDDPDQPIKSNAAWDLLDRFDREVREDATAPHTPEQTDYLVEQIKAMPEWAADKIRGLMRGEEAAVSRHTEQAHGDALAALDEMSRYAEVGCTTTEHHKRVGQLHGRLRFYLTASGVPYVPYEVRRLPEKYRHLAHCARTDSEPAELQGQSLRENNAQRWETIANEIESALASAPADGWKLVPVEPTQAMIDAGDAAIECPEDWSASGYYGNDNAIAYRAMIAAAPQRGGES